MIPSIRKPSLVFFLIVNFCSALCLLGQERGIVKGEVFDNETKKPVPNVNVIVRGEKTIGTATDSAGCFRLELPVGSRYVVVFSHIAYQKVTRDMSFEKPKEVEFRVYLQPEPVKMQEVVIRGEKPFVLSKMARIMAHYSLDGAEFERLGEKDMEKAMIYLLPSVVKPLLNRMIPTRKGERIVDSPDDFTLYVNGEWKESIFLDEIDPFSVKRVMVWDANPFISGGADIAPIGLSLRRGGKYVVLVETK